MKILLCHTAYLQRGGEQKSFEEERQLLVAHGHQVIEYVRSNEELKNKNPLTSAQLTLWNRQASREVEQIIGKERPDVMHCTNTFPLISPSVCHTAHRHGVAVVQALRNYRLICPGTYLMRDGKPCNDCVGQAIPWPAVLHRCYRDSAAASAVVASMVVLHRALGTWQRKVDAFFSLTQFARQRFVEAGFPEDRTHVKYNCVYPDPGVGPGGGGYLVFVGRLSPEKGVATLLEAWASDQTLPALKIIGDGPLAENVRDAKNRDRRIEWLGELSPDQVLPIVGQADALLMPSVWYETFGRTIAEAFATGTPVVASRLGAMQELVEADKTGYLFEAGSSADLIQKVHAFNRLPVEAKQSMRAAARAAYEKNFTPEQNYQRLIEIYTIAQQRVSKRKHIQRSALSLKHRSTLVGIEQSETLPSTSPAKTT